MRSTGIFKLKPCWGLVWSWKLRAVPVIFSKLKVLENTCLTILVLAKLSVLSVTPLELGNKVGIGGGVVGEAKS